VTLIWATRGRTWGFRFLLSGGFPDPLPEYEKAFAAVPGTAEAVLAGDGFVAARFLDPEGRCDQSGRPIPHEFVLYGDQAEGITTVQDARAILWPLVRERYAEVFDRAEPPRQS